MFDPEEDDDGGADVREPIPDPRPTLPGQTVPELVPT